MSTRQSSRVRKLPPDLVEVWRAAHRLHPSAGEVPARRESVADGGGPWTELQTQTLVYSREALGLTDAGIARYVGRSPQSVGRRAEELVRSGRLRPHAGELGLVVPTRRSWQELRSVIRGLYEERVPNGTIELMLGITPMERTTQLRRLFQEGLRPH
jgi:hypothetical protein